MSPRDESYGASPKDVSDKLSPKEESDGLRIQQRMNQRERRGKMELKTWGTRKSLHHHTTKHQLPVHHHPRQQPSSSNHNLQPIHLSAVKRGQKEENKNSLSLFHLLLAGGPSINRRSNQRAHLSIAVICPRRSAQLCRRAVVTAALHRESVHSILSPAPPFSLPSCPEASPSPPPTAQPPLSQSPCSTDVKPVPHQHRDGAALSLSAPISALPHLQNSPLPPPKIPDQPVAVPSP
ncbi:hypothetical protein M0R45_009076 [Rubus argutus]|uniref:Uncharacterized protein n=1 Tax=Rubus argutus TaxID=59490 RepID=A0AAW1Y5H9_RUBAR